MISNVNIVQCGFGISKMMYMAELVLLYVQMLKNKCNVIMVHKKPCSLYNTFDFVKSIFVKAEGALSNASLHFKPHVPVKQWNVLIFLFCL